MNRSTHLPRRLAVVLAIASMTAPAVASAAPSGSDDTTPTTEAAAPTTTTEPLVIEGDPACTPYVGVTHGLQLGSTGPRSAR